MFEWDDGNADHVRQHRVEPEEAEEALLDPGRIGTSAYNAGRERRWAYIGAREVGRILFVVVAIRRGTVRVVTARDASAASKRRYRRRGT